MLQLIQNLLEGSGSFFDPGAVLSSHLPAEFFLMALLLLIESQKALHRFHRMRLEVPVRKSFILVI